MLLQDLETLVNGKYGTKRPYNSTPTASREMEKWGTRVEGTKDESGEW
jgi:hypothetical protein